MAIRRLGPVGAEITLPSVAISLPVVIRKKMVRAEMSDGSADWAFFKDYKTWGIRFPNITKSELDDLISLRKLNQILRWQNYDESETWYDVVMTDFDYDSEDPDSPTADYFASMSLEEVV